MRQELGSSYWFSCFGEIVGFLGNRSRFLLWILCNFPALILPVILMSLEIWLVSQETRQGLFYLSVRMVVVGMKRDDAECDRAGNGAETLLKVFC